MTEKDAPAPLATMVPSVQHVSLNVADVEASLPFYVDVLGLEVLPRPDFGFPGAWLGCGNGVAIHLIEEPGYVPAPGPHVAFETADLDADVARLRGADVEVSDPFEIGGMRQAFFADPCGNRLELNQPPA